MNEMVRLGEIAHARSGDKGNHANIGVIAYTPAGYEYIGQVLTETKVAELFLPLRPRRVERFAMPGILAYNFVLYDVLGGGAGASLRIDSQGKTFSLALLDLLLPRPSSIEAMRPPASESRPRQG